MGHRTRAAALLSALTFPLGAQANSPFDACSEPGDLATQACLLQKMTEDPSVAEGPVCSDTVCRVELSCEASGARQRHCTGSDFDLYIVWNAERQDGFDVYVTEPDGNESWYYLCAGLDDAAGDCVRPRRLGGSLDELDLLAFPGGALLEYSPVRATEPPAPLSETYRVPPDIQAGAFNVRSGPGTTHEILFSIPAGIGGITLDGECRPPEPSGQGTDWCPIIWQGQSGWISSRGLEAE